MAGPGSPCPTAPAVTAHVLLLLGWWPAVPSQVQEGPPPSLSLHPDREVALGDMATLRCRVPRSGVRVSFYKDGSGMFPWYVDDVKDVGELAMEVTRNSAGRYRCRYEDLARSRTSDLALSRTSDLSDPVDLVVLDPQYSPPTVSLSPGGRVKTGANVTISCRSPHGATFILHKKGRSVPVEAQRLDTGDTATFILRGVTVADAGTYGCSYRALENPFISSHPRAEVTMEVASGVSRTPPSSLPSQPTPPGAKREPAWSLAVVGGCVAALVIGLLFLAWCCRRRSGKGPATAPRRAPSAELLSQDRVGASPQDLGPLQPPTQEDAEGLTYAELQPMAPGAPRVPTALAPSVLYAEVGGREPR